MVPLSGRSNLTGRSFKNFYDLAVVPGPARRRRKTMAIRRRNREELEEQGRNRRELEEQRRNQMELEGGRRN